MRVCHHGDVSDPTTTPPARHLSVPEIGEAGQRRLSADAGSPPSLGEPAALDAQTAIKTVGAGAFLLDVRSPAEAAAWTIESSVIIPIDELDARLGEVPLDREIVVYCAAGPRSERAARVLTASGRAARWLPGGISAWYEAALTHADHT